MTMRPAVLLSSALLLSPIVMSAPPREVLESARAIPVAYEVDVVVVGASTGAIAAAVQAVQGGAKVFLAAPRPYLGDDMTATLRLWLEPGEVPVSALGKEIFLAAAASQAGPHPRAMKFAYSTDQPSDRAHPDTTAPSLLCDGVWGAASKESVQYNGDVTIVADLGETRDMGEIRVMYYCRPVANGGSAFDVESVVVFSSEDNETWKQITVLEREPLLEGAAKDVCVTAKASATGRARYVKLVVKKAEYAARILLGEVELIAPSLATGESVAENVPPPVRPLHVKKTLDEALLTAGVQFLYSCYATDVLRDGTGNLCGIVMTNRGGRQAVIAKTIIDATDRAAVARLAGAQFRLYPAGLHTFRRTVIGGAVRSGANLNARLLEPSFNGRYRVIEYTLRLPMSDSSYAAFAVADQRARTLTYDPEQQFTSDRLFEIPPDSMRGAVPATGPWQGTSTLPLGAFRPEGIPRLYVLGGCADVSRGQAEKLLRPLALIDMGIRIGVAAAAEAGVTPVATDVQLAGSTPSPGAVAGDIREALTGIRPTGQWSTVPQEARGVPVLAEYDVVVVGGGTGGAPAGIAAARHGAKTLVIEYLSGLGGVGTMGAIANYCSGNRVGFSTTIPTRSDRKTSWVIEQKMEWYRSELLKAGADIWFGTLGCGALVDGARVTGVTVATPSGRGVVLGKVVVDCTGNADIASAVGAECMYVSGDELAMQGTGLPPRNLGAGYTNTDFTITDETDMVDVWHMFVYAKEKYRDAFDQGQLIDTRERRCIVGEHTLTIVDIMNQRTYPDTVVQANGGSYDTHGYTVDPYLLTTHPGRAGLVNIPYRCMVPRGVEGLLVASLGLSAHRDAIPLIRMQADVENGGYAAGVAAAMAATEGLSPRNISVHRLQKHLVGVGNLRESVLTAADSYPLPSERIEAAAATLGTDPKQIAVVFSRPYIAVPMLRDAYAPAKGAARGQYALVLAMLGDATGLQTLIEEVSAAPAWDEGWNYRAMGQFGSALSPLDKRIVALGRTRDKRALPVILAKVELLSEAQSFSHHRAVALALEAIADPAAAKPLFELLSKPGMAGHMHTTVDIARKRGAGGGTNAVTSRRESIRELSLARALYRCGDYQGRGEEILRAYIDDLRGHFSRHALAVLSSPSAPSGR